MEQSILVSTSDSHLRDKIFTDEEQELVFQLSNQTRLNVDAEQSRYSTSDYFTHQITREPKNLRAHTQRIHQILSIKSNTQLFGALADLFIALGENGYLLRKKMLNLSQTTLAVEQSQFLTKKLETGLTSRDFLPFPEKSFLSKGYKGTYKLVKKTQVKIDEKKQLLVEAQNEIKNNHLDVAREILEGAIEKYPKSKAVNYQLLEVYRVTKDLGNYQKTYSRLSNGSMPHNQQWIEIKKQLELE